MGTQPVKITRIGEVIPHPNADRLDLYKMEDMGWWVISSKLTDGLPRYKVGDKCIYIPVDSMMDEKLIRHFFEPDGKIQPDSWTKHRIRSIKIRGSLSQGAILDFTKELEDLYPGISSKSVGTDVADILNITKYEPPLKSLPKHMQGQVAKKRHPDFREYTDINNYKFYDRMFQPGDHVYITEKLHGTSARYACLPTFIPTGQPLLKNLSKDNIVVHLKALWKKTLKALGLLPKSEFIYGSRRVQLDLKLIYDGFYQSNEGNVYAKIAKQLDLKSKLQPGEILFGEIVGSGIQKNYTYGLGNGEHRFYAYDVQKDGQFLRPIDFLQWCRSRGVDHVPVIADNGQAFSQTVIDANLANMFHPNDWIFHEFTPELIEKLKTGDSTLGGQKVREGIVVKPYDETNSPSIGRVVLKCINDDYYLAKDNTEFH